jgi:cell wall-associated NlpC family hydrolase
MPSSARSLLHAFALAAIVFACAGGVPTTAKSGGYESVAPRVDRTPIRHALKRPAPTPTLGERAAKIALNAVGVPYRWGGSSPASGFDCSGLVYWAYGKLGVELPHSSYALYGLGRGVKRSRMKPGDVLFFSGLGHVGLYIGRGRMVHAPQSGRTVEIVRLGRSHYGSRLVAARRLVRA